MVNNIVSNLVAILVNVREVRVNVDILTDCTERITSCTVGSDATPKSLASTDVVSPENAAASRVSIVVRGIVVVGCVAKKYDRDD